MGDVGLIRVFWVFFWLASGSFFHLLPQPLALALVSPRSFAALAKCARRKTAARPAAAAMVDQNNLDASLAISDMLEAGDKSGAQEALGSLHAATQRDAYALCIADFFLSGQVSVRDVVSMKMFASLLLDEQDELGLAAAHATSVSIFASNRPVEVAYDYDENLRVGGAFLRVFSCMRPVTEGDFLEDSLEARACAKYLNCLDPEIRDRESRREARRLMGSWLKPRFACIETLVSPSAFDEKLSALENDIPATFALLTLSERDARDVLRKAARSAFAGMISRACALLANEGTERCCLYVERILDVARLFLYLMGPLDQTEAGRLQSDKALAKAHLTAIALSEMDRAKVYRAYAHYFARSVLSGVLDLDIVGTDMYILECLLSQNEYVTRDINVAGFTYGLELAAGDALEQKHPGRAERLLNIGELSSALGIPLGTEKEARVEALVRIAGALLGAGSSRGEISPIATLLDLSLDSLDSVVEKEERRRLNERLMVAIDEYASADIVGRSENAISGILGIVEESAESGMNRDESYALVQSGLTKRAVKSARDALQGESVGGE
jgi:hypothetical protein